MMRRSLLVMVLCAVFGLAHGEGSDVALFDSGRAERFLEFDVHAGIGFSSVLQNYSSVIDGIADFQMSPGCKLQGGIDVRFALRRSVALGTGLDFAISNSRYAMNIVDRTNGSISSIYMKNHFGEVQVPVYISFRFNLARSLQWNVDGGWYFAKGLGGSMKASGYVSGENSIGQPIVKHTTYDNKYFNDDKALINGVRNFDHGVHLATGFTYRRFRLSGVLHVGARNLAINHGVLPVKYHNISLMFLVGYNF